MKIDSLMITGMHNIPKTKIYSMDDMCYIYGANGAGKSTVLQAIQLALLGYIPGTDKNKTAIFRHANGCKMSVDIVFDTGDRISRTWTKNGATINADMNSTCDIQQLISELELPIFNFNEFANMSANKLKDWFIDFLPDDDVAIDWKLELTTVIPESLDDVSQTVLNEALDYIESLQGSQLDIVRGFNEYCKMQISVAKNSVSRLTDTMQSIVHYDDFDTALAESDVLKCIDNLQLQHKQLSDKISAYKANSHVMTALKGMQAKYNVKTPDELDAVKVEYESELSSLRNDKTALDAEIYTISDMLTTAQAESLSYKRILDSKGMCPYTKSECDSMQSQIVTAQERKQVSDTNIKDLMDRHTAKSAELHEVTDRISSVRYKLDSLVSDKEMFESLMTDVDENLTDVNIDELEADIATCVNDIHAKQDILVKIKANKKFDELKYKVSVDVANAEETLDIYKKFEKRSGVNGLQSRIMLAPFVKFSSHITKYLTSFFDDSTIRAVFNIGEKSNSFSFGINRNDKYIDFDLLSSGEKCLYTLSLLLSIVDNSSSDLKLIMVDDLLDHLDDNRIYNVFRTLYKDTDVQVLLAGVKPCTYEPVSGYVLNLSL